MTECSTLQRDLTVQYPKPESSIYEVEITEVKMAEKRMSLKEHKKLRTRSYSCARAENCAAFSVPLAILFKKIFQSRISAPIKLARREYLSDPQER